MLGAGHFSVIPVQDYICVGNHPCLLLESYPNPVYQGPLALPTSATGETSQGGCYHEALMNHKGLVALQGPGVLKMVNVV